jgi:hypothetical protein
MTRLFVATMCLTIATAPAFACEVEKSASTETQKNTVASQPANNHSTPQSDKAADQKPS